MADNIYIYQFKDCQVTVTLGCPGSRKDGGKLLRICAMFITIAAGFLKITLVIASLGWIPRVLVR